MMQGENVNWGREKLCCFFFSSTCGIGLQFSVESQSYRKDRFNSLLQIVCFFAVSSLYRDYPRGILLACLEVDGNGISL